MTDEERRARRYNQSPRGRARNARYEQAHPERAVRWERGRNQLRPRNGW